VIKQHLLETEEEILKILFTYSFTLEKQDSLGCTVNALLSGVFFASALAAC